MTSVSNKHSIFAIYWKKWKARQSSLNNQDLFYMHLISTRAVTERSHQVILFILLLS